MTFRAEAGRHGAARQNRKERQKWRFVVAVTKSCYRNIRSGLAWSPCVFCVTELRLTRLCPPPIILPPLEHLYIPSVRLSVGGGTERFVCNSCITSDTLDL
jgi:hypothetical protein